MREMGKIQAARESCMQAHGLGMASAKTGSRLASVPSRITSTASPFRLKLHRQTDPCKPFCGAHV